MDLNKSIKETLEKENATFHEASQCVECTPRTKIRNAFWTTFDRLDALEKGGVPIYFDEKNILIAPYSHCLVTGSSGTGKSEAFYKNQVKILANYPDAIKPSMLITDLKGDISQQLCGYLKARGYATAILNMTDPIVSAQYNFLLQVYDDYQEALRLLKEFPPKKKTRRTVVNGKRYATSDAAYAAARTRYLRILDDIESRLTEIAHIIISSHEPRDKTWTDGARTMLKAIMWRMLRECELRPRKMPRECYTISNVCRTAYSTGGDCENMVEWLSEASDIDCVRNAIASNYGISAKVTRDGYVSTLNTPLGEYTSNTVGMLTATSDDLNLRTIANSEKPYAIFIITDDRRIVTNNICMMFMNNLIAELVETADRQRTHALPRDFVILSDEFANMPAMPKIEQKITTLRSRRIWMMMAIQSLKQLDTVYGADVSTIIQDNCDLSVFLGCNNDETKAHFSNSLGQTIGVKSSVQISNDGSVAVSKATENVPVVRKSDLDALELGEFYVRARQCQNMKTYMKPYFMQEDYGRWESDLSSDFRDYDKSEHVYDLYEVMKEKHEAERKDAEARFRRLHPRP